MNPVKIKTNTKSCGIEEENMTEFAKTFSETDNSNEFFY